VKDEMIFYVKKGRRYVPHSTYSSEFCDSFPKGTHLVQSYPGGSSRRFNIDPAYAPMIAAGRVAEDAMCRAIQKASEMKPKSTPITEGQRRAWKKLAKEFGEELATLHVNSAHDIAEAGLKAMMEEADKLLANPTVRKAYEKFLFVAELAKEHNEQRETHS
jgi:hypothetical protein